MMQKNIQCCLVMLFCIHFQHLIADNNISSWLNETSSEKPSSILGGITGSPFDEDLRIMPPTFDAEPVWFAQEGISLSSQPLQTSDLKSPINLSENVVAQSSIPIKPQTQPEKSRLQQMEQIAEQIQLIVKGAFADVDSWLEKDSLQSSDSNDRSQNKKTILLKKINDALDQVEKSIQQPGSLQQMNKLVGDAMDMLDHPIEVGAGKGSKENIVIAGIVNSLKTTISTILSATVKITSISLGAVGGTVAGATVGLGAGVHRAVTGKVNSKTVRENLLFKDVEKFSVQNAPKIFVNYMITALYNVVQLPVLTAYAAAEGFVLGITAGGQISVEVPKKIKEVPTKIVTNKIEAVNNSIRNQNEQREQTSWLDSLPVSDSFEITPNQSQLESNVSLEQQVPATKAVQSEVKMPDYVIANQRYAQLRAQAFKNREISKAIESANRNQVKLRG